MKTTIIQEFTEKDKELLKAPLPENPCNGCPQSFACLGCADSRAYERTVKPYKDAGIYDIALSLQQITKLKEQIKSCEREISDINEELPDFCKVDMPNA